MKSSLAIVLVLAATTMTRADGITADARRYRQAISVQLATLDKRSATLQYEHGLGARKLSLAGAVGVRSSAMGEYGSLATGVGIELRRWWTADPMTGWYVSIRTDLTRTTVQDELMDRRVGSLVTWSTGVHAGRRWVVFDALELAPSIGTSFVVEGGMAGRSPPTARGALVVGLTAGYIF